MFQRVCRKIDAWRWVVGLAVTVRECVCVCERPTQSRRPDSRAKIRCSFCFCKYGRAYNFEASSVVAAVAIVSGVQYSVECKR